MKLFFSVGEPSGDVHTAQLISELRQRAPDWRFRGYGGPEMEKAGCRLDYQMTELAVMGFLKVAPHLWKFYRLAQRAKQIFREDPPDAVVLVDFPGFNWHIARYAHDQGIPVFYYLPPQLWAWASGRVRRMKRSVDHVLCCFPFEPKWYAERGIETEYVGHPIFDEIAAKPLDETFLSEQSSKGGQIVGILPGSRGQEVSQNWPVQLEVLETLQRRIPTVRFLVANYQDSQRRYCEKLLADRREALAVEFHVGKTSEIIEVADACMMVSGSVSLEMLARATPAIVMYRSSWAFAWFCRHVIECSYMSLPNLFAERMLMPEFYLTGPTPSYVRQMTDHLSWWLCDPEEFELQKRRLAKLCETVLSPGAVSLAADVIHEKLSPIKIAEAA